jgi:thiol-disulfide isomerase/thioredoxin
MLMVQTIRTWIDIDIQIKQTILVTVCFALALSIPGKGGIKMIHPGADGVVSPNDVIDLLDRTVKHRQSAMVQNLLLGKKAPAIHVEKWLSKPEETFVWPPTKFTILHFWSIHCSVCVGGLNRVCELAERVEAKGGAFLSIHSFTETGEIAEVLKVLKDHGADFSVALDSFGKKGIYWDSKTFPAYGASGLPLYVTVGADGRILSHKAPAVSGWEKMIATDPAKIQPDIAEEIRPVTVEPLNWVIDNAEPHARLSQRFLLYRADTPELNIRALRSSNPEAGVSYTKHSNKGQSVFVLSGKITAPAWGETIKGTFRVEAEYSGRGWTREIPYIVNSKPPLDYSKRLYIGVVERGKESVKRILLRSHVPRESLTLTVISAPEEIAVQLPASLGVGPGKIPFELRFRTSETGTREGTVKLQSLCSQGRSKQILELKYVAIVHD